MAFRIDRPNLTVVARQRDLDFLVTFRYPRAIETRQFFRDNPARFAQHAGGKDTEYVGRDGPGTTEFLLSHIEEIKQVDGRPFNQSVDEIRSMLRKPRAEKLVFALVNSGLFDCNALESADEPAEETISFDAIFEQRPIVFSTRAWDESIGGVTEYRMRATLAPPNAEQTRLYNSARPIVRRRGEQTFLRQSEQVTVIQRIFEERIQAIENACFGDDETDCTEETREQWREHVPYHFVSVIMSEDAGAVEVGNAS